MGINGDRMKICASFFFIMLLSPIMASAQEWKERADWAGIFADAGITGTIAVVDERTKDYSVHDMNRSQTGFIPASTFKIPHALIALDAGVAKDEFQIFRWDGKERQFPSWNRDQNLRSSLSGSVVWVYQSFARQIGEKKERRYLHKIGYGNADVSGGADRFWLDGSLRISARDQVEFLQKLYRNKLPFRVEHQRLVKDLMVIEASRGWILRAKSGWAFDIEPQIGWFVGWVETPEGAVFFALNINMPGKANDVSKREAITRTVLKSIQALPPN